MCYCFLLSNHFKEQEEVDNDSGKFIIYLANPLSTLFIESITAYVTAHHITSTPMATLSIDQSNCSQGVLNFQPTKIDHLTL